MSNRSGTVYVGDTRLQMFEHLQELLDEYVKETDPNKKHGLKQNITSHYIDMYIHLPELAGKNVEEVHADAENMVNANIKKLEREKGEVFWENPLRNFLFGSRLLGEYNYLIGNRRKYSTYLEGSRPPSRDVVGQMLIDSNIRVPRKVTHSRSVKASRSAKHGRRGGKKNRRKTKRTK